MRNLTASPTIIGQCRACGRMKTDADPVVIRGALIYCPGCNPRSWAPETGFDVVRSVAFTLFVLFAGCFLIGLVAGNIRPARGIAIRPEREASPWRPAPPIRRAAMRLVPGARYLPVPPPSPAFYVPRSVSMIRPAPRERAISPAEFLQMARARQSQQIVIPASPAPISVNRSEPEEPMQSAPVRLAYQGTPPLPGSGYHPALAYIQQGWAQGQTAFNASFGYHGAYVPRPLAFGFHPFRR